MDLPPGYLQYMLEHKGDSKQAGIIATATVGLVLSFTAVALRFWARYHSTKRYGWDDWLILIALVPLCGAAATGFINMAFGLGLHIIYASNPAGNIKTIIATIVTFALTTVLTKASILCFYNRIFPNRGLKWLSIGIIIFTSAYSLALIFVGAFMCIPLSAAWTGRPGRCISFTTPQLVLGICNVVTDFVILSIPIRFVLGLKMTTTRKIQVIGMFLTGAIVVIFSILRVQAVATAPKIDPTWNQVWSGTTSFCEMFIGIVAACLPTMGVLFTKASFSSAASSARRMMSSIPSNRKPKRPSDTSLMKDTQDESTPEKSWATSRVESDLPSTLAEPESSPPSTARQVEPQPRM